MMFCFGLANLVILHVFRFEPSGKLVSSDFQSLSEKQATLRAYYDLWNATGDMPESGQTFRGLYLLFLVIYVWVGGFLLWTLRLLCGILQRHTKPLNAPKKHYV